MANPPHRARGYVLRFGLLAVVLVSATAGLEWFLRWRYVSIAQSDQLTTGLTRPDPELGWMLTPRWTGTHSHHDFRAAYTTNGLGFRGADIRTHRPPASLIAIVGDSFTFGTGVNDAEVFTELLDRESPATRRVYNFAVPGFSTDQEVLLAERDILLNKPQL